MGRVAIGAAALTTMLLAAAPLFCQTALLVDTSGSVRPYYDNRLFPSLAEEISAAAADSGEIRLFSFDVETRPLKSLKALAVTKSDTYLDRALQGMIDKRFEIVWMITDNIQDDPRDAVAFNTKAFYGILRSDAVKRVVVLPLAQPPGQSGVAIYAILLAKPAEAAYESQLLAESAEAAFDHQLDALLDRLKGRYQTEALQMKPLDEKTVDAPPISTRQSRIYDEGTEIVLAIEIRFRSKLKHLRIVDTQIEPVVVEPVFGPESLLQPERRSTGINPDRIQSLDPEGETAEVYTVNVNLGKVRLKRDLGSMFKAAWGGKSVENVTLSVPVHLQVPLGHFRFRDSFLERYNAPDAQAAKLTGKVYAIDTLPQLLSADMTDVKVDIPIAFRVRYPWYPIIVTLGLGLLAMAVVAGAVWGVVHAAGSLTGAKRWVASASTEYGQPLPTVTREDGMVIVDGDPAGEIKKGQFVPAEGAELVESDGRISAETPMTVRIGRQTALLKFAEAPKGGGPETPVEPEEPTYRE